MIDISSIEELLTRSVPSPSEKYTAHLRSLAFSAYDRHYQSVHSKRRLLHRKQVLGWASALAFVVFAFIMFTPTGRALAQQILQFGFFIFTNEPTEVEQYLISTPEIDSIPSVVRTNLAEASEIAGFPVYYPTFLPEGYIPISPTTGHSVEVLFNSSGDVIKVNAMFERAREGEILSFSQIPLDFATDVPPLSFGTGQVEPQVVYVDGNEGVWLENFIWGTRLDENGDPVPIPYNLMIWEMSTEKGYNFQFWLGSEERLTLDVMFQIADSVVQ